ncbi:hypothetical protein D3C72_1876650 [compost metagenome]
MLGLFIPRHIAVFQREVRPQYLLPEGQALRMVNSDNLNFHHLRLHRPRSNQPIRSVVEPVRLRYQPRHSKLPPSATTGYNCAPYRGDPTQARTIIGSHRNLLRIRRCAKYEGHNKPSFLAGAMDETRANLGTLAAIGGFDGLCYRATQGPEQSLQYLP